MTTSPYINTLRHKRQLLRHSRGLDRFDLQPRGRGAEFERVRDHQSLLHAGGRHDGSRAHPSDQLRIAGTDARQQLGGAGGPLLSQQVSGQYS